MSLISVHIFHIIMVKFWTSSMVLEHGVLSLMIYKLSTCSCQIHCKSVFNVLKDCKAHNTQSTSNQCEQYSNNIVEFQASNLDLNHQIMGDVEYSIKHSTLLQSTLKHHSNLLETSIEHGSNTQAFFNHH